MTKAESKERSLAAKVFDYLAKLARTRFKKGKSKAAAKRKAWSERGKLYQAKYPGQLIDMSDRSYTVAKDGSFRRNWRLGEEAA